MTDVQVRRPISAAQQNVWLGQQLDATVPLYNVSAYVELHGEVDVALFRAAVSSVVAETDGLRSSFSEDSHGVWETVHAGSAGACELRDLRGLGDAEGAAHRTMDEDTRTLVDPAAPPLFRAILMRLEERRYFFYFRFHHLVTDGWGQDLLLERVGEVYSALVRGTGHPPPRFPSSGVLAQEDAEYRASTQHTADRDFWAAALEDVPGPTTLADRPTGLAQAVLDHNVRLADGRTAGLEAAANHAGARWSAAVIAVGALYVHRLTGLDDVVVTVPVPGRITGTARQTPGMRVNEVPLRVSVRASMSFTELITQVSTRMGEALAHQRYRVEDIRHDMGLPAGTALSGVIVNVRSHVGRRLGFAGCSAVVHLLSNGPVREMLLDVHGSPDGPGGIRVALTGNPALYTEEQLAEHQDRFLALFDSLIANPAAAVSRADMLAEHERELLLPLPPRLPEAPAATLPALFEEQAARTPDAVAVGYRTTALTYAELNEQANRLARYLVARGVGPESFVALLLPCTDESVVAVLAVLKAGASYIPVDPEYPAERIGSMLRDVAPSLVLTTGNVHVEYGDVPAVALNGDMRTRLAEFAGGDLTDADRTGPLLPGHPAYVIFTSGSSGTPKGVVIPHGNVVRLFTATADRFRFGPEDVWTLFHSLAFDFSVWELWGALLHGGRLVIVPHTTSRSPGEFLELLADERVTVLNQTPSAFYQLSQADAEDPETGRQLALRTVVFGGEALEPGRLGGWYSRHGDDAPELVNMYGITETTVHVSYRRLSASDEAVRGSPIGESLTDLRAYVLDSGLNPVPPDFPGELYVAGGGLARGYLNRPSLTADRFPADPFGLPGARMYRTGDLVRATNQGELVYLGRADDQVKIRGFRIELGEIETVLARHPSVAQCAVIAREHAPGDQRLVAYVVPAGGGTDTTALREHAGTHLPEYMVPSAVVVLGELPLTTNGKLNRKALPAPARDREPVGRGPRGPREETLCAQFADVLGLDRVGIDDDFFARGGHSLLATRLVSRLRSALDVELTVRNLFEAPTVARLGAVLDSAHAPHRQPLTARARPDRLPLSFAQRRFWFLHRLEGPSHVYNVPVALRLSGPLDQAALRAALADLITRHESLRTVIGEDADGAFQLIREPGRLAAPVEPVAPDALDTRLAEEARYAFDLGSEIPVRARVFGLSESEHVLLLVVHHIAADGWSMRPLVNDLADSYRQRQAGGPVERSALPAQYADYMLWQRDSLGEEDDPSSVSARQLRYWRTQLADLPEELPLPADRIRPAVSSYRGDWFAFEIPAELHSELGALARESGASVFMVLQAGLAALLHRLGAGTDIPIGSPVAGRTDGAMDGMVGLFVNTLVLRIDVAEDPTVRDLVARVRETALTAYDNQDLPFERLVDELNPSRSLARHPLFQVMMALNDTDARSAVDDLASFGGLAVHTHPVASTVSRFDLAVNLTERRDRNGNAAGIAGGVEYSTDLFDRESVREIADSLLRVLRSMVAAPDQRAGQLDVMDARQRRRVLDDPNATERDPVRTSVPELFRAQAARTPEMIALVSGDREMTYAELDAWTDQCARYLDELGVRSGAPVALMLDRSLHLVGWVLAVLKAGGIYVPLHASHPDERLRWMIGDAGARLLISDRRRDGLADLLDRVDAAADVSSFTPAPLPRSPHPDEPAYVMYTSGSTGQPKGVAVTHANVAELATDPAFATKAHRCVLVHSSHAFDASTYEVWVPLLSGGRAVIAPGTQLTPQTLEAVVRDQGVSAVFMTTALFNMFSIECTSTLDQLDELWFGGEGVSLPAVEAFVRASEHVRLVHVYGPTETTTFAAAFPVPRDRGERDPVPIGSPMSNTRAYVLDHRLSPVPVGVPGELYLGGSGLARGYAGRPDRSAERFVADPFGPAGERMYRTGDVVRWSRCGAVEFVGRADDQVKIRGFRIELGEIEAVLSRHPSVAGCAVVLREDRPGDKRIVAYVVAHGAADAEDLGSYLTESLPDYMVPAAFVLLDALPLTTNGKLDRAALPAPDYAGQSRGDQPRSPTEELLCALFADVLGRTEVGVHDGFFVLGGDSISSIQLVSAARRQGLEFSVRDLFEHKTVAGLSMVVRGAHDEAADSGEDTGTGVVPVTPVLAWFAELGGPMEAFHQAAALQAPGDARWEALVGAVQAVLDHHHALRARLRDDWTLEICEPGLARAESRTTRVYSAGAGNDRLRELVQEHTGAAAARLAPSKGRMLEVVWLDRGAAESGRLIVVAHHLVVDGVSWRILLPDLVEAYQALSSGRVPALEPVRTSLRSWACGLHEAARDEQRIAEVPVWRDITHGAGSSRGVDDRDPRRDTHATAASLSLRLAPDVTEAVLGPVPELYRAGVDDVLLTALALALIDWPGNAPGSAVLVDLEGHGRREELVAGADLSRTVGWFTSIHPVRLDASGIDRRDAWDGGAGAGELLKRTKERLRAIRGHGMGYGLLRYLNPETADHLADSPRPEVAFNYLGRFGGGAGGSWGPAPEAPALSGGSDPDMPLAHALELNAVTEEGAHGGELVARWTWASRLFTESTVRSLAESWFTALEALAAHAESPGAGGLTPSDVPLTALSDAEIDRLQAEWRPHT